MTADRLLEGGLAPDDAPQGYQEVAAALHAAAAFASDAPTHGSDTAVSAFLDAIPARRTTRMKRMKKWQIAAAALAGGLTLSTGLAAADVLPSGAQDVASSALSHVGIHVPSNDDNTTVSTVEQQDQNEDTPTSTTEVEADNAVHPDNHGGDVSAVAHDKTLQGQEHGAAVSNVASNGKSQAGEDHGKAADDHAGTTAVEHPNGDDNPGDTHAGTDSSSGSSGSSNSSSSGSGSTNSGTSTHSGSGS
ncbi:MAG: hypothetical protein QOE35_447 [Actinomycetota bacterium]